MMSNFKLWLHEFSVLLCLAEVNMSLYRTSTTLNTFSDCETWSWIQILALATRTWVHMASAGCGIGSDAMHCWSSLGRNHYSQHIQTDTSATNAACSTMNAQQYANPTASRKICSELHLAVGNTCRVDQNFHKWHSFWPILYYSHKSQHDSIVMYNHDSCCRENSQHSQLFRNVICIKRSKKTAQFSNYTLSLHSFY